MGVRARQCGACTALELLEKATLHGRLELMFYEADEAEHTYLSDMQGL